MPFPTGKNRWQTKCNKVRIYRGKTEEEVREALRKANKRGDDYLSKDELKMAVKELGSRFACYRVHRCLKYADIDHDGRIGAHELDGLVAYILKWQASKFHQD